MTTEEAVREELREARHQEIMLFAKFMQALKGDPQIALFIREQMLEAGEKIVKIRGILHGVLEGERIRKERECNEKPAISNQG